MPRLLAALLALLASAFPAAALEFHLTYDRKVHDKPFTGRAYVLLFAKGDGELQGGPNWFRPEPFFATDVKNVKPGEAIVLDKAALGYPVAMDRIPKGTYTVQAVIDLAPNRHHFTKAPGNLYTVKTRVELDPAKTGIVLLNLDQVYKEPPFKESERIKLVEIESKLLSDFHKRPTHMRAGVLLPASYAKNPMKKYPVVYEIPGFSGNHRMITSHSQARGASNVDGVDVIHVMLDPDCHHGHHVFADSANNGPCGKALIEELIPAIEKKFRAVGVPAGRLLTGHSSGGWSSLWLQVTYPDVFGGCWSTAPDPVDFRDFQRINLYRPGENMFTDADNNKRPIARMGGRVMLYYKGFSDMEVVMGHGGQLASFEACFSERGDDGQPRRVWNRKTGKIDTEVAKTWEKYDIRLVLERNWQTLGPKLKGKLHVYMGDQDTFYLEGATRLLKESQAKLKSDAKVELFAGYDHSSLMRSEKLGMYQRIAREMAAKLREAKVVE